MIRTRTLPEIIISPLAKGNAYASTLPYSHSSDLKTMDEIFGLAYQTNAIPARDRNATGTGYNSVATANDLSDMFRAPGSAPVIVSRPASLTNNTAPLSRTAARLDTPADPTPVNRRN